MLYTKDQIQLNLTTNPKWIERSLIVLFKRQTHEEKQSGETRVDNGVGFNSSDSRYLSYCAKWVMDGKHLNQKHLEKCGGKLKKYWKQIISIIEHQN